MEMNFWSWKIKESKATFLNSLALHQHMLTLLWLVLKDHKVENYNVFSSLEDIKHMLWNKMFCLDNMDYHLACVQGFLVSDSTFGDLRDPSGSSSQGSATISSLDHE